jgi:XTP/dITP diphosphohydrolase
MTRVVLATHNAHKVEELRRILGPRLEGYELVGYDGPDPAETGTTFAENALIKARAAALHTGLPALADDSGIGVDVMGGSPGIFSARWSGPRKDAGENLRLLLWQLTDVPAEHRQGSFTCAAALVVPATGEEHVETAVWRGRILSEPRGDAGFGYDPIFRPVGYDVSAAELPPGEKDRVGHRAMAFERITAVLAQKVSPA